MKKLLMLMLCVMFAGAAAFAGCGSCGAGGTPADAAAAASTTVSNEVGNNICPVMGEPITDATKVQAEVGGRVYNFCCQSCADAFKQDPKKYLEKMAPTALPPEADED